MREQDLDPYTGSVTEDQAITLHARDVLSKWGFDDGDLMLHDQRCRAILEEFQGVTSHELLVAVVRRCLLPRLHQHVELAELVTLHNPARAESVDGVKLDGYGSPVDGDDYVDLTPDLIVVALDEIRAIADELSHPAH